MTQRILQSHCRVNTLTVPTISNVSGHLEGLAGHENNYSGGNMSQQQFAPEVPVFDTQEPGLKPVFTRRTVPLQAHNLETPLSTSERVIIWVGTISLGVGVGTTISWLATIIAYLIAG